MPIVEVPILSEPETNETPDELMRRKYREYKQVLDVLHEHLPPEVFTQNSVIVRLSLEIHMFEDYVQHLNQAEDALKAFNDAPTQEAAAALQEAISHVAERVAAYDRYIASSVKPSDGDDVPF